MYLVCTLYIPGTWLLEKLSIKGLWQKGFKMFAKVKNALKEYLFKDNLCIVSFVPTPFIAGVLVGLIIIFIFSNLLRT